jgi:hypothetical protein
MSSEMKKRNRGRWRLIEYLLKCALGILFIFAGATKSWDPADFSGLDSHLFALAGNAFRDAFAVSTIRMGRVADYYILTRRIYAGVSQRFGPWNQYRLRLFWECDYFDRCLLSLGPEHGSHGVCRGVVDCETQIREAGDLIQICDKDETGFK